MGDFLRLRRHQLQKKNDTFSCIEVNICSQKTLKRQTGSYELEARPRTHNPQRIDTKNVEIIRTNKGKSTHKKAKENYGPAFYRRGNSWFECRERREPGTCSRRGDRCSDAFAMGMPAEAERCCVSMRMRRTFYGRLNWPQLPGNLPASGSPPAEELWTVPAWTPVCKIICGSKLSRPRDGCLKRGAGPCRSSSEVWGRRTAPCAQPPNTQKSPRDCVQPGWLFMELENETIQCLGIHVGDKT